MSKTLNELSAHLNEKEKERTDAENSTERKLEKHQGEYVTAVKWLCDKIDSLNTKIDSQDANIAALKVASPSAETPQTSS